MAGHEHFDDFGVVLDGVLEAIKNEAPMIFGPEEAQTLPEVCSDFVGVIQRFN